VARLFPHRSRDGEICTQITVEIHAFNVLLTDGKILALFLSLKNCYMNENDSTPKMTTMSEYLDTATQDGFVEDFSVRNGKLVARDQNFEYKPENVKITNFFRFEGYSDPEDNSILYLIETSDGKKGTLIVTYGPNADASRSAFIRQVESIEKEAKPEHDQHRR
jgi:hypothetical protein